MPTMPFNFTVPEWAPLQRALADAGQPESSIGDWMWMCEHPEGNHQYKHCDTRRYVHLRTVGENTAAIPNLLAALPEAL